MKVRRESNKTFLQNDYKEAWWVHNRSRCLDDTRSGAVCKRLASEAELSPQSKVNQGVMRVYLVQWHRATLCRKLGCGKVRIFETWEYTRVIGQLCYICCVKGVSRYRTTNPSLCDCCNMLQTIYVFDAGTRSRELYDLVCNIMIKDYVWVISYFETGTWSRGLLYYKYVILW